MRKSDTYVPEAETNGAAQEEEEEEEDDGMMPDEEVTRDVRYVLDDPEVFVCMHVCVSVCICVFV